MPQLLPTESVDPAAIVFIGDRVRLAYSRDGMAAVEALYGYPAAVGIFAHELGHLIDLQQDTPPTELGADVWAGCALAIAGLRTEPLELFLTVEAPDGSMTHPPATVRIEAVNDGHRSCGQLWE